MLISFLIGLVVGAASVILLGIYGSGQVGPRF